MLKSDSINELAAALAKAQGEFKPVAKSGENPLFHSKYVVLDDILQSVMPILAKNGLALMQFLSTNESGAPTLETSLLHTSGQWIGSIVSIPSLSGNRGTNELQNTGGALTYMRRYAVAALLGVASDDDVDGNAPVETKQEKSVKKQEAKAEVKQSPKAEKSAGPALTKDELAKQWSDMLAKVVAENEALKTVDDAKKLVKAHFQNATVEEAYEYLKSINGKEAAPF